MRKMNLLLVSLFLMHSVCFADEVGLIKIKEPKPPKVESQENKDEIGILTVPGDLVPQKKPEPSEASDALSSKLSKAENLAGKKDYPAAFETINKIRIAHPDTPIVWKWAGIYAVLAEEYEQGIEILEKTRIMFPLDEATQNGIEFEFYKALALMGMKEPADELIEKIEQAKPFGFSREMTEDQKRLLVLFLRNKKNPDIKSLEQAWQIEHREDVLNNYHGFMLSELYYMYGMELDRKGSLENYVKLEEKNECLEVVKRVQAAKRALRKT